MTLAAFLAAHQALDHNSLSIILREFSDELRSKIDKLPDDLKDSYKTFFIPKRNRRGFRQIDAPSEELKSIQREISQILDNAIAGTPMYTHAFGFIKGKSIGDNVIRHSRINTWNPNGFVNVKRKVCNKNYWFLSSIPAVALGSKHARQCFIKHIRTKGAKSAIRIDIKNAFSSTDKWMIESAIKNHFKLSEDDLKRILKVCLLDNYLPQGAPSSPILLNIVLSDFDHYSSNLIYAKLGKRFKVGYKYSRYADDIIVTCDNTKYAKYAIPIVYGVMKTFGYKPNKRKTMVMSAKNGIFVNGINLVNSIHHVSVTKKNRNKIRAMINNIAILDQKDRNKNQIESLKGKISHVMHFDLLHGLKLMKYAIDRKVFRSRVQINKVQINDDIVRWIEQSSSNRANIFI
tara:strand:+ start:195 stop:1403 length:1209 start_codon:yes stop_codon:yes gene_type:complete